MHIAVGQGPATSWADCQGAREGHGYRGYHWGGGNVKDHVTIAKTLLAHAEGAVGRSQGIRRALDPVGMETGSIEVRTVLTLTHGIDSSLWALARCGWPLASIAYVRKLNARIAKWRKWRLKGRLLDFLPGAA